MKIKGLNKLYLVDNYIKDLEATELNKFPELKRNHAKDIINLLNIQNLEIDEDAIKILSDLLFIDAGAYFYKLNIIYITENEIKSKVILADIKFKLKWKNLVVFLLLYFSYYKKIKYILIKIEAEDKTFYVDNLDFLLMLNLYFEITQITYIIPHNFLIVLENLRHNQLKISLEQEIKINNFIKSKKYRHLLEKPLIQHNINTQTSSLNITHTHRFRNLNDSIQKYITQYSDDRCLFVKINDLYIPNLIYFEFLNYNRRNLKRNIHYLKTFGEYKITGYMNNFSCSISNFLKNQYLKKVIRKNIPKFIYENLLNI